jgi:maltose alpha-D-glucosyltransferase/alpha-amylase
MAELQADGRSVAISGEKDPFWYKKAIIYELHVRSFHDGNADGIGDFQGLTQKLDYLQDLGITAIWLLPFYPSPLRDDGYDIADYYAINPIYGSLDDFKTFLNEAHARNLRVITELVINHTSEQHPWFQRARRSPPGSNYRDYYVWSNDPTKYKEVRIIFKDFEPSNWTWDPVAHSYYWHRFFFHQPDLNFDNPSVHEEIIRILDFWLDMGVDGMRLDAIPYLYEREGTSCESLPETHGFLKKLRHHVDEKYGDRIFLAEANQWPEDAVAYFGDGRGDECHMAFHFPVMPRLFMSLRMEDRFPIIDILNQTPPIPETSEWAIFLRNHDELTLEMVTDEERDYMYRMYAADNRARINLGIRRRLAPLLQNDRRKIELLNMLLLSLPGTPVLYYGDEIGMGDNMFLGDRNGVRTPMHWSSDKNAGFSRATPQALVFPVIVDPEYHYESSNVEAQQRNPNSLLWWHKRVLALRKRWAALTEGRVEFLHPHNRKVLAFVRQTDGETVLIIANLSRFAQAVELNLSRFKDCIPVELFGQTHFPEITDAPYLLTLTPYASLWFALEPKAPERIINLAELPQLRINANWTEVLGTRWQTIIERRLPGFLRQQAWFLGRGRTISTARLRDYVQLSEQTVLAVVNVDYNETDAEDYLIPLSYAPASVAGPIRENFPHLAFVHVEDRRESGLGLIFDSAADASFWSKLVEVLKAGTPVRSQGREITPHLQGAPDPAHAGELELTNIRRNEHNNSSVAIGEYFLKLVRRIEPGIHPEVDTDEILSAAKFPNMPPFIGSVSIRSSDTHAYTVLIANSRVPNTRTGWELALDSLDRFFERVVPHGGAPSSAVPNLLSPEEPKRTEEAASVLGTFVETVRLLGQRTAELHLALASATDPASAPEPFVPFTQRSIYQSFRNLVLRGLQQLSARLRGLPPEVLPLAEQTLASEGALITLLKEIYARPLDSVRIRIHGNLHLGQVLHTGKDFLFIDFEGEPHRPYGERRLRRAALGDIAGMLRSIGHVSHAALAREQQKQSAASEKQLDLNAWIRYWREWIATIYFHAYRTRLAGTNIIPPTDAGVRALLNALLIENAFTELRVQLESPAPRLQIPLTSIVAVLERSEKHDQHQL